MSEKERYLQRKENADSLLHEDGHVLRLLRHHVAEDSLGARRFLAPPRVSVPGELRQKTVLWPIAARHAVRERNSVLVVRQLVLSNKCREYKIWKHFKLLVKEGKKLIIHYHMVP